MAKRRVRVRGATMDEQGGVGGERGLRTSKIPDVASV